MRCLLLLSMRRYMRRAPWPARAVGWFCCMITTGWALARCPLYLTSQTFIILYTLYKLQGSNMFSIMTTSWHLESFPSDTDYIIKTLYHITSVNGNQKVFLNYAAWLSHSLFGELSESHWSQAYRPVAQSCKRLNNGTLIISGINSTSDAFAFHKSQICVSL